MLKSWPPNAPLSFRKVFKDRMGKRIVLCKIKKSTFFFLVVGEIWDSTSTVFLSSWSSVSLLVVSTRLTSSICVGFIICKSFWRIWLRRDLSSGRNMFGVLENVFFFLFWKIGSHFYGAQMSYPGVLRTSVHLSVFFSMFFSACFCSPPELLLKIFFQ